MTTAVSQALRPAAPAKARNIIAVASGKGGVGKTWLAITLAHALARLGRRTLLFDGDLGLANVDIQLGLMPEHDLGGVLASRLSLAAATLRFDAGGFDIIAGRSGCGRLAGAPAARLAPLGENLVATAAQYDHVVLDLGAGLERTVRELTRLASCCVIVTTDEPTSLTDAYAFVKVAHLDRTEADMRIVVNIANSAREGERTYRALLRACESFLNTSPQLLGVVRRDPKVPEAIRSQTSLLTRFPNCAAATDVEAIATRLTSIPFRTEAVRVP
jgi:flagellar biosynthesis protein FlhG